MVLSEISKTSVHVSENIGGLGYVPSTFWVILYCSLVRRILLTRGPGVRRRHDQDISHLSHGIVLTYLFLATQRSASGAAQYHRFFVSF